MDDLRARLGRFEERQEEIIERLVRVESKLDSVNGTVSDLTAEVGRVPQWETRDGRQTVTDRLHAVEGNQRALHEAIVRRAVVWSRRAKYVTVGCSVVAAVGVVLRLLGVGG